MSNERAVWIDFTNRRGERAVREIIPYGMVFYETEWHPEKQKQWLFRGLDVETLELLLFAIKDIHAWHTSKPAPPSTSAAHEVRPGDTLYVRIKATDRYPPDENGYGYVAGEMGLWALDVPWGLVSRVIRKGGPER